MASVAEKHDACLSLPGDPAYDSYVRNISTADSSLILDTDERYNIIRRAQEQVTHNLPSLWQGVVPHPEVDLRILWIPLPQNETVQLGPQGQGPTHHWNWTNALLEAHDKKV